MRQVNVFTDETRFSVVQEYLQGGKTQEELMLKYNIRGKACITNWMRKFGVYQMPNIPSMKEPSKKSVKEQKLEQKIRQLESDLKKEQLRSTALSTMIDIAERDLKIDIRKKSGAKR